MSPAALLPHPALDQLRSALADYTVDAVHEALGRTGTAALASGDRAGVARALREVDADARLATLIRLFLLAEAVPENAARAAFAPLPLAAASGAGIIATSAGEARALIDVRPYREASGAGPEAGAADWWVVSDFGAEVRGGPLAREHVLGVGAAALTLAQATPRDPVARALDIGTGCGVQALHLARHANTVVATDVSKRALRFAATTAALSGQRWELRAGSLLEPVAGERFDLVVANPPFVVSGGGDGFDYRDSGVPGDALCAALVGGLPGILSDGGTAQLLANWMIRAGQPWEERVTGWLTSPSCDAWVWQREVAAPADYVSLWLRDAGEVPGTSRWAQRYDAWLDWLEAERVEAIGMGLITIWRSGASDPVVVCEDVPQPLDQPVGAHLPAWHRRQRWLADIHDDELLEAVLRPAAGIVRTAVDVLGPQGWRTEGATLRQTTGLCWEVDVDEAIAALVAGCDGTAPLGRPVAVLAAALGRPVDEIAEAIHPVVRDLVGRGFLEPVVAPARGLRRPPRMTGPAAAALGSSG